MFVPYVIHPDAFKGLEPGSKEHSLWLGFFKLARLNGILVSNIEILNTLKNEIPDGSPFERNFDVLRKASPNEFTKLPHDDLVRHFEKHFGQKPKEINDIYEFHDKHADDFVNASQAYIALDTESRTMKRNVEDIEKFFKPILTFSTNIQIWDKYIGLQEKKEEENEWERNIRIQRMKNYAFTIRKILEWTEACNLKVNNQDKIDFIINTEEERRSNSGKENDSDFDEIFEKPLKSVSEKIKVTVIKHPHKKGRKKEKNP